MKFFKKTILLLALVLVPGTGAFAGDNYLFRLIDASCGLPDNNIRNVLMLPDGRVCIQSPAALIFYNGSTCRSYSFDNRIIPYSEYSGQNGMWYDSRNDRICLSSRDYIWAFDIQKEVFDYQIVSNPVSDKIYIDSFSDLWVFSQDGTITVEDASGVSEVSLGQHRDSILAVGEYDNSLWMYCACGTLLGYNRRISKLVTIDKLPLTEDMRLASRIQMAISGKGRIFLMSDKSILTIDIPTGKSGLLCALDSRSKDLYTSIAVDTMDRLWIGTARSGVSIISPDGTRTSLPYMEAKDGRRIQKNTDISRIYADSRGGVWVATQEEGLLYWHKDIHRIKCRNSSGLKSRQHDESVKCLLETEGGNILMGTVNGLLEYNPSTESFSVPCPELADKICISLYRDRQGSIWVGTFYDGMYRLSPDGKVKHYSWPEEVSVDVSYLNRTPNRNCVRAFAEDSKGRFWLSVYGGLGIFDKNSGELSLLRDSIDGIDDYMVLRQMQMLPGDMLLASGDNGRLCFDCAADTLVTRPRFGSTPMMTQSMMDSRGCLWLAQPEGLCMMSASGCLFTVMPGTRIMSLVEDISGNVWASSFNGISRISPVKISPSDYDFAISSYTVRDGVDCGTFFQNSAMVHSGGRIYFGGTRGICIIDPASMFLTDYGVAPVFSSFSASGAEKDISSGNVSLSSGENYLRIAFTNLNYAVPEHTLYRYKLEPFDDAWHFLTSVELGTAEYSFLPPGKYVFTAQAAMNGLDWSPVSTLHLEVRPPFYSSIAAYVLYALAALLMLTCIILYINVRARRRMNEKIEQENRRKQDELNEAKFQFFTNISHELRTPLSLILLPLERLMEKFKDGPDGAALETIQRNAEELTLLVNNILDFKKLGSYEMKLNAVVGDFVEFCRSIVSNMSDAAAKKGLELKFISSDGIGMIPFDAKLMKSALDNLLWNAIKFTPEGGSVTLRLSRNSSTELRVEVIDTGIGIPEGEEEKIFDRFFRSDNAESTSGSGLGLHMSKNFIELHGGHIFASSRPGKGSVFTILLPVTQCETVADELPLQPYGDKEKRAKVMVVDDNAEFRSYLASELSQDYSVVMAADGKECLDLLKKDSPDIIICDVMMPVMDGLQVSKAVKENVDTSHISVILLSARLSEDVRQKGYETGADAYLTKPFKMSMLQARIRNLLDDRKKRISSFSRKAEISPMHLTITTVDQKLMARIMDKLEKNMGNPDYSVEELASDVGMHRMNLYRKIQSLYSMTPSDFIRTMRLKRAAQIIRDDPNLTVSEVAEMVGFNTTKYFTKYFKELFGTVPSQYGKDKEN